MLVDPSATSAVHHYLLLFINGEASFSSWEVIFSWYRVEIYTWHLDENIVSWYIELQFL